MSAAKASDGYSLKNKQRSMQNIGGWQIFARSQIRYSGESIRITVTRKIFCTFWLDDDGNWNFPYLNRNADERKVNLNWTNGLHDNWNNHWSFLVASTVIFFKPVSGLDF